MEEHGTHLSKHEAKGGLRSALRVLLVCFIVIAINLQLTYFDRAPYGAWSARYILKLFGDVSFVPLVEAYFLYHLVERLGEEVERWPIIYLFPAAFFAFTSSGLTPKNSHHGVNRCPGIAHTNLPGSRPCSASSANAPASSAASKSKTASGANP